MNKNVIKMARLMGGCCKDRTCEDCLSQSKKLFGDNKCALIEYAEVLDKADYRKQSETVKEFAEKLKDGLDRKCRDRGATNMRILQTQATLLYKAYQLIDDLAEQYSKEDTEI